MADDMMAVTGLWKNTSKTGNTYLSGNVNVAEVIAVLTQVEKVSPTVKVLIFTNGYKEEGDNKPTHKVYFAPKEETKPKPASDDDVPF